MKGLEEAHLSSVFDFLKQIKAAVLYDYEARDRLYTAYEALPTIIQTIETEFPIQRVVVFGSTARNEAKWSSDVDLAVTLDREVEFDTLNRLKIAIYGTLNQQGFNTQYNNRVQIVIASEERLSRLPEPGSTDFLLVKDIQEHGVTIYRKPRK